MSVAALHQLEGETAIAFDLAGALVSFPRVRGTESQRAACTQSTLYLGLF